MAKSPPEMVMTIMELSKYLKISRTTLYKLAQEGKLPAQKIGRHTGGSGRTLSDRRLEAFPAQTPNAKVIE